MYVRKKMNLNVKKLERESREKRYYGGERDVGFFFFFFLGLEIGMECIK